ncbi:MAG: WYL domain-containing protein [Verrucomicrobiota bacterium]
MKKSPKSGRAEIRTRPPLARMMRVHESLQHEEFPNCRSLGEVLEVSYKTVQRDIDFMRDQLGLPIDYDATHFGFYYTEEVREFPNVQVSEGELIALFVAQKALTQYQGTSFERPLSAAFRKLTEGLKDEVTVALKDWDSVFSFKALGPSVTDIHQFDGLSGAIRRREVIRFQYKKLNSRSLESRQCHPYHLTCVDNQWYLFGYDIERQAIRTFVLSRMSGMKVTGDVFQEPDDFDVKDYLKQSFGVFSGDREYRVVLRFDLFGSQLVRERQWHASQIIREQNDGAIELELTLGSLPEIERWVLSWGEHVRVIAPEELRQSVLDSVKKVIDDYELPC